MAPAKYDLIFAVHSWYYIEPNPQMILKALSLLGPKGKLLIAVKDKHSYSIDLHRRIRGFDIDILSAEPLEETLIASGLNFIRKKAKVLFPAARYINGGRVIPERINWVCWMTGLDKITDEQLQIAHQIFKDWQEGENIVSHESLFYIWK